MRPIYLDYNATTPADPLVIDAVADSMRDCVGNAASIDHIYGSEAAGAVKQAREQVASLIGAEAEEIVFTSGATESDNIAVLGVMARAGQEAELVVSAIEHPAVLEPASRFGARLRVVPVGPDGVVDPGEVRRRITTKTALVSVMAANNETGAVQPIVEIGAVCAELGVPFHTDAVQAAARLPIDVDNANASLLSISAHKMYGPKGIGALYVRRREGRVKLDPIHYGGGHERNLRPGTANVPAIVGFGVAAQLAKSRRREDSARERKLRNMLAHSLQEVEGVEFNAPLDSSLAQTLNVRVAGVRARALMHATRERLAFSSGSACATTKAEPSHALLAQGLAREQAGESIRLSFGRFTNEGEIATASDTLLHAIAGLRRTAARAA